MIRSRPPIDDFFLPFLEIVGDSLGAQAAALWRLADDGQILPVRHLGEDLRARFPTEEAVQAHCKLLERAASGETLLHEAKGADDPLAPAAIYLAPLVVRRECIGVVEAVCQPADREEAEERMERMETAVGLASQYLHEQTRSEQDSPAETAGLDLSLVALRLHQSLSLSETAASASNDGRLILGCDRLSVFVNHGRDVRPVAISGQSQVNRRSALVKKLTQVAQQAIRSEEPLIFTGDPTQLPPEMEEPLAELIDESGLTTLAIIPLMRPEPLVREETEADQRRRNLRPRKPFGCLLAEWKSESGLQERPLGPLKLFSEHAAAALSHADEHRRLYLLRAWKTLGRGIDWFHGRRLAAAVAILAAAFVGAAALMLIPWEHRVVVEGRLAPQDRQVLFAPMDGRVSELQVHSGGEFAAGAPLLRLVNDELEVQLVELRSQLEQSRASIRELQQRARKLVESDGISQTRALLGKEQLQLKGLQQQLIALERREAGLLITAPKKGVVTTFNVELLLRERPVKRGEQLLELMAADSPWQLELDIPAKRVGHVIREMGKRKEPLLVEFVLLTEPTVKHRGKLIHVGERSITMAEKGNVFEAVAQIDGQLTSVRFGADTRAKIYCGKKSLGYVLFGDLIDFLRAKLWI
ncbi:GAF domain-containing protein [Lignipirellula cremea]|uniref:GAF domain-containing protein n=1 Tax=Lignipirellula cremea TaxID=2528010 RepID=UPI0011A59842|nr:GAF domain-containing protein [Lignipirellula cremea]